MDSFKFPKLVVWISVLVVSAVGSPEAAVIIRFIQAPPEQTRFSTALFLYAVEKPDGTNACKNNGCSFSCELDGKTMSSCPADGIVLNNLIANQKHMFLLNVTTHAGGRNSSSYSWFIDAVPPTATISSDQNYTNARQVAVDIAFSEPCTGLGGFKCLNSSNCDIRLDGPAYVQASSLRIIKPFLKYRLDIILSSKSLFQRVVITMEDNFCTDKAGNSFTRSNASVLTVHFDRRPVLVDLWMPVPSYVLEINGVPRTVLATNKLEDLKIFLEFSIPLRNSTQEVLNALHVNSGSIMPTLSGNHGNRKFFFYLKKVSDTEIITVELEAGSLVGMSGSPVLPVALVTVLFDSMKPEVGLSTSSPNVTKASYINVIIEFTKPVFGFQSSMVSVEGGKITRFKRISRALYSLSVLAVTQNAVSITVPEGKVNDIAGNQNLASNHLEIQHYTMPAISVALHSFVSGGVLVTSLAAAVLSLASANLRAIGTLAFGSTIDVASNPSMNLHGMIGHLQVFVLSDWLSANHPIEYSETTKGLRWLIPRQKLPWKEDSSSVWPNHVYFAADIPRNLHYDKNAYHDLNPSSSEAFVVQPQLPWLHGHNVSMKSAPYGLALNSKEYFTYFLRGEPLSASNVVKTMENYNGWQDLKMNMFWLGVGAGSLLVIHGLILLFLRWRTGTRVHGMLSVPRFELLLIILSLPCISQSSAFVMKGGTMGGIIAGAFLLVIPAALILSVGLFLVVGIFSGSFAQYKEIKPVEKTEPWYKKILFIFIGKPVTGKWFYREGLPSSFLPHFAILFENRKGPPLFVFVDQNDQNTIPKWTESGQSGIGRMRALSLDGSNEEIQIPVFRRLVGCARSSYIILDLARRVSLGVISGAFSSKALSPSIFALVITVIQFICLFTLKPYIRRGVNLVESISLLCEVGLFSLSTATRNTNPVEAQSAGCLMLALLFLTFVAQIMNEWYALIQCVLRISQPQNNSFWVGLKLAAKGLVLPFLPRKYWPRVLPHSSKPKTGLSSVPPLSPETEFERRDSTTGPDGDQFSAPTTTVAPVVRPDEPGQDVVQSMTTRTAETTATGTKAGEGKRSEGLKVEQKSELRQLRELAKASFKK